MNCGTWIARLALVALLVVGLSACNGHKKSAAPTTAPAATVSDAPPPPEILTGSARHVTFAEAKRAIDELYRRQPSIKSYVYKDVVYTPQTRDEVLSVCRLGSASNNSREKETSRVFGCAPLIFFFYNFGRQKSVPESIEAARKLFWYAAEIPGPYEALPPLTDLLQRWGVR